MRTRWWLFALVALLIGCSARSQDEAAPPAAGPGAGAPAADPGPPHPLEGAWELRMERTVWWPNLVPGSLVVSRGPKGPRASLTFDPMWGVDPKRIVLEPSTGDAVRFRLEFAPGETMAIVTGTVRDDVFVGEIAWEGAEPRETCFISASRLAPQRRFEPDSASSASDALPPETDLGSAGLDAAALDRLLFYAGRYDTDSLVVAKHGRLVCDRTFLRPRGVAETDAITRGIASLAIPLLVEEGKLPRDLATPLVTWFPEWKSDERKSRITLRHVLTHTSGLAFTATGASSDYLGSALRAAAGREPGTRFEENAQAFELVSGVITKAAGEQADTYLERRVLRPLGITRWRWPRDAAGNVPTYGGLEISGPDLARIGAMLADGGQWKGQQVVPKWWIDAIATPSEVNEEMGLAWSLMRDPAQETVFQTQAKLGRLQELGFADAPRLAPLVGKSFENRRAWWKAAGDLLGREATKALYGHLQHPDVGGELRGPVSCFYLHGSKGQYLLVFPEQHLVVVRGRRGFAEKELPAEVAASPVFRDLPRLARELLW